MKLILLYSSFSAVVSTAVSCLDPAIQGIIDKVIERDFIPHHHITGLGLTIVKDNGKTAFTTKGYGFKDLENGLSANGDTLFGIGSVSKSFAGALVVKTLHETFPELGESALDVPIRKLCPTFNLTLTDRYRSESTSFRDLLSHKLCLRSENYGWTFGLFNKQEFLYRQRYAEEKCPFRTDFVYSDAGIFMATEIIAQIANSTFEEMLTDFFRQIGMNDTTFVKESDDYNSMPNLSRGYYRRNEVTKEFNRELLKKISIAPAAGGVLSSPNDMAKYMMFHLNNGKAGSVQVIPEEVMKYMRRNARSGSFNAAKRKAGDIIDGGIGYGLGIGIGLFDGWERWSHGGCLPPYEGLMSLYPTLNLGIYTVSNGPGALMDQDAGHSSLHRQIFEIIQKGLSYNASANVSYTTASENLPSPIPKSNSIFGDNETRVEAKDIVGVYGNGLSGEFKISIVSSHEKEGGDLYFKYGKWGTGILSRRSNSCFVIKFDSDVVHEFYATETPEMEAVLEFSKPNFAILHLGDESVTYEKDLTLDKLPSQPWDSNSCGPTA